MFEYFRSCMETNITTGFCKTVPRADCEAVIASVETVPDERTEFLGDGALVFNGEVGNAPWRVHVVRASDGICGARVDTGDTLPTVILGRRIGLKWKSGD